jgi:hypothetical protein
MGEIEDSEGIKRQAGFEKLWIWKEAPKGNPGLGDPVIRGSGTRGSGDPGIRDKVIPDNRIFGYSSPGLPDVRISEHRIKLCDKLIDIYDKTGKGLYRLGQNWRNFASEE